MSTSGSIPRRDFLAASGVLTGLIAAGGPLALIAPARAWSVELQTLSTAEGARLLSMTRTIAPHDRLEDAAYALVVKAIEHSEFFQFVRAKTLATLYASAIAYAHFGYEGEAFSKGGYLTRGFNDLDWLPDVPLEDSGPVVGQTQK